MNEFEILERDGFGRLGRLTTPHGPIETPTLLPVVHPDPERQPIAARLIASEFGFPAVMTSAYITWNSPKLRVEAIEGGIHRLLDYTGPIMTDSGAFQEHAYGHVAVSPSEILQFQEAIGSDIATVLDVFGEPWTDTETARRGLEETLRRAREARSSRRGLLAVPVQGGIDPSLRRHAAEEASRVGDVLAVGGVVPLLERYRFATVASILLAARPGLAPEQPVHLFGAGHPMLFALAALAGVDLFDSSSYHKFARRGDLLFATGTRSASSIREPICSCYLCVEHPLNRVAELAGAAREKHIARHNLLMCRKEISRVRQAIREGTLWELAELRAASHPALLAALETMSRGAPLFLPVEPTSRRTLRLVLPSSRERPAISLFHERLRRWRPMRAAARTTWLRPLTPAGVANLPPSNQSGIPIEWDVSTPLGNVPFELSEVYPVGAVVDPSQFLDNPHGPSLELEPGEPSKEWIDVWTARHAKAILEWEFGPAVADTLAATGITCERSRRSGRLRRIGRDGHTLFFVGPDGLPWPTFRGAERVHAISAAPTRRILVDPDAAPFVEAGRSLFTRFVRDADARLRPGAAALLVDSSDRLLAVGRLLLGPHEMGRMSRGVAVRVTAHVRGSEAGAVERSALISVPNEGRVAGRREAYRPPHRSLPAPSTVPDGEPPR